MNRHGSAPKYSGEERVSSAGSNLLKRLFEAAKPAPKILSSEAIKNTQKAVVHEVKAQGSIFMSEMLGQVVGVELSAGKAHTISKKAEKENAKPEKAVMTQEHMEYFAEFKGQSEKDRPDEATMAIKQELSAILAELRNLKDSSDELENVFKDVVVDEVPEKPGIYHLTFFEGFLKLVIKMRDKVEDGVTYAKLFRGRRGEKSYSAMAKKGGTSFTMHQDRAVATQTG